MKVLIKSEVGEVREKRRIKKNEVVRGEDKQRNRGSQVRLGEEEHGENEEGREAGASTEAAHGGEALTADPCKKQGDGEDQGTGLGPLSGLQSVSGTWGGRRTVGNMLGDGCGQKSQLCPVGNWSKKSKTVYRRGRSSGRPWRVDEI